jgi:hypothetical protein
MGSRDGAVEVNGAHASLVTAAAMPNRDFSSVIAAASGSLAKGETGDWAATVEMEPGWLPSVPGPWRHGFVDLHVPEDFEELGLHDIALVLWVRNPLGLALVNILEVFFAIHYVEFLYLSISSLSANILGLCGFPDKGLVADGTAEEPEGQRLG